MLTVTFVPIGGPQRASSRLRVYDWLPMLEREGVKCNVVSYYGDPVANGEGFSGRLKGYIAARAHARRSAKMVLSGAHQAKAVFLQESLLPGSGLDRLRRNGVKVIFDFSDPLHLGASATPDLRTRLFLKHLVTPRLEKVLSVCDAACVENDLLRPLAGKYGAKTFVMRGPVNTTRYVPKPGQSGKAIRIGWSGSAGTLPLVKPLYPLLSEIGRKFPDVHFVLYGVKNGPSVPNLRTSFVPFSIESEPQEIASFDVALFYLPENHWTRYRGGAKLLQYMACGLPIIASPMGIGDQVIKHGENGLIVRSDAEWRTALETLIANVDQREHLGRNARATAVNEHSYEAYLPQMLEMFGTPQLANANR